MVCNLRIMPIFTPFPHWQDPFINHCSDLLPPYLYATNLQPDRYTMYPGTGLAVSMCAVGCHTSKSHHPFTIQIRHLAWIHLPYPPLPPPMVLGSPWWAPPALTDCHSWWYPAAAAHHPTYAAVAGATGQPHAPQAAHQIWSPLVFHPHLHYYRWMRMSWMSCCTLLCHHVLPLPMHMQRDAVRLGLPLIMKIMDLGYWLTLTRSPGFPPSLMNHHPVCPIAIQLQHHCPIASPCTHLPFIVDLAPQWSHHPSLWSHHAQASSPCTNVQGLVSCGPPLLCFVSRSQLPSYLD